MGQARRSGIAGYTFESGIQEETLRALSYFTRNNKVKDVLIDALHSRCFVGCQEISTPWDDAMYALSALGNPDTLEHLEYWANYGEEAVQKRAQRVIELFGKATFDEIKDKIK